MLRSVWDEAVEHGWKLAEVWKLGRARLIRVLLQTVDPDRAEAQFMGGREVMEWAGANMHMLCSICRRVLEEAPPVAVCRLV